MERDRNIPSLNAMARHRQRAVDAKTVKILPTKMSSAVTAMRRMHKAHKASSAMTVTATAGNAATAIRPKDRTALNGRMVRTDLLKDRARATEATAIATDVTGTTATKTSAMTRHEMQRLAIMRIIATRTVKDRNARATTVSSGDIKVKDATDKTAMVRITVTGMHKPTRPRTRVDKRASRLPNRLLTKTKALAMCCATR